MNSILKVIPGTDNFIPEKRTTIDRVCNNKKIRSKFFRNFLDDSNIKLSDCQPTKTRYSWCNQTINVDREKALITLWNVSFAPMHFKDFCFMFLNNRITMRAHRANFPNSETSPLCTFCFIRRNFPSEKENFVHVFKNCPFTSTILEVYFGEFLSNTLIPWNDYFIFIGAPAHLTNDAKLILNLEILMSAHFINTMRIKKKIPLLKNLKNHIWQLRNLFLRSNKYKKAWNNWKTKQN